MNAMRAQSAMEYLITYGWAIMIIVIVLGSLLYLGVFSTADLGPRLQPGGCQVNRPEGALSTKFMTLEGTCNGEIPQYVGTFKGTGYITASSAIITNTMSQFTISVWTSLSSTPGTTVIAGSGGYYGGVSGEGALGTGYNGNNVFSFGGACCGRLDATANPLQTNKWYHLVGTYDAGAIVLYINGVAVVSGTESFGQTPEFGIGGYSGQVLFDGEISNVQVYNTSLDQNSVTTLYNEGIGGAPVDLLHLVSWWPLNGNANDYSGNNYNGAATNVSFISSWTSSYTPPSVT